MVSKDKGVPRILIILIVSVGVLWAGSLVLDAFVSTYDPPETIGLAFMAILSTLLGFVAASQRDGGNDEEDDDDKENKDK